MAEQCTTPERECPFDKETIERFARMEQRQIDSESKTDMIYRAVTNGNGLTQRMNKAEEFIAELKGGSKAVKSTVIAVGVVLTILQIALIVLKLKGAP